MYNALLGGVALDGKSFCYTNPLINSDRAKWHICPCCVGNVSRTLLMVPTWTYLKSKNALYVNMFVGSRIHVGEVAGHQRGGDPEDRISWHGAVSFTVNPEETKTFSVFVRIPDRTTSKLYRESPAVRGVKRFAVNGQEVKPTLQKGYAVVTREWKRGDRIELELPMEPQRVRADKRIQADGDLVALKYGPLIYNVETADNENIERRLGDGAADPGMATGPAGGRHGHHRPLAGRFTFPGDPKLRTHEPCRPSARLSQGPQTRTVGQRARRSFRRFGFSRASVAGFNASLGSKASAISADYPSRRLKFRQPGRSGRDPLPP